LVPEDEIGWFAGEDTIGGSAEEDEIGLSAEERAEEVEVGMLVGGLDAEADEDD